MDPQAILVNNHDIHLHSKDYSDGCHPAYEVIHFAARWQDPPRWVGLSDHNSPQNEQTILYIRELRKLKGQLKDEGISLLVGMELDWTGSGPTLNSPVLAELDYVLAGYHGLGFASPGQVEAYLQLVAQNEYTDVVVHPDRFLGDVDVHAVNWTEVFQDFHARGILCEYNLTTPLRQELFEIAVRNTDVGFVIGSDTHDFRSIAIRRIIDAWSESLGGGFDLSYAYLKNLLRMEGSSSQVNRLSTLFGTIQLMDELQHKVYLLSLEKTGSIRLEENERKIVSVLERIPECDLDHKFIINRLERFSDVPAERISSTFDIDSFRNVISEGRKRRKAMEMVR